MEFLIEFNFKIKQIKCGKENKVDDALNMRVHLALVETLSVLWFDMKDRISDALSSDEYYAKVT